MDLLSYKIEHYSEIKDGRARFFRGKYVDASADHLLQQLSLQRCHMAIRRDVKSIRRRQQNHEGRSINEYE